MTAGHVVFQGSDTGEFCALDARDGRELFKATMPRGINASPMTTTPKASSTWQSSRPTPFRSSPCRSATVAQLERFFIVCSRCRPGPLGPGFTGGSRRTRPTYYTVHSNLRLVRVAGCL